MTMATQSDQMVGGIRELHLVVHHRVPTLNQLFKMGVWRRYKEKKTTHLAVAESVSLATAASAQTQTRS